MRKIALAILLSSSLLAPAMAQQPQPPRPGIGKAVRSFLDAAVAKRQTTTTNRAATAPLAPFTASTLDYGKPTNIPVGWYFTTANLCGWFLTSTGDQTYFVLSNKGPFMVASVNNFNVATAVAPACAHGFGIWWHVTDATTGAFDAVYGVDHS